MPLEIGIGLAGGLHLAGPLVAVALYDPEPLWLQYRGATKGNRIKAISKSRLAAAALSRALCCFEVIYLEADQVDANGLALSENVILQQAVEALAKRVSSDELVITVEGKRRYDHLKQRYQLTYASRMAGYHILNAAARTLAAYFFEQRLQAAAATWPAYGFEKNLGKRTPQHLAVLYRCGLTPIHRAGVSKLLTVHYALSKKLPLPDWLKEEI